MINRKRLVVLTLMVGMLIPPSVVWAIDSPYNVANKSQLFVDRLLVRQAERIYFTQHEGAKHPQNPLVKADQPWEGWRLKLFGSVIYDTDEKLFKMWYLADLRESKEAYFDGKYATCYATSLDGITWKKPLVGTLPAKNNKPHNAVSPAIIATVIKDGKDTNASHRYKMITKYAGRYATFVSPDGLKWERLSKSEITRSSGDVITGYWDESRQLFAAFPKQEGECLGRPRRLFSTITSKDFIHWSNPVRSWTPDLRDDAGSLARLEEARPLLDRPDNPEIVHTTFYGIGAYEAESCTIGFPWIFTPNNKGRFGGQDGPMEVQLAVSRDLLNWDRPFRTPVIGRDMKAWDGGFQQTAASAIRFGDEIRLYYCGGNYTHGTPALYRTEFEDGKSTGRKTKYTSSIGLITWKLDRFVSADGPAEGGVLDTIPIRFTGKRLEINAAARPGGSIVVELLDAAGRSMPGFEPSRPFLGDELRQRVTFGDKEDVSALAGKAVTLRFRITNASLYGFAFRG